MNDGYRWHMFYSTLGIGIRTFRLGCTYISDIIPDIRFSMSLFIGQYEVSEPGDTEEESNFGSWTGRMARC
jgi:hypothetical protein